MRQKLHYFLAPLRFDPKLILFGFCGYMGSSFGQTFFVGIFAGEFQQSFGLSHGEFGGIYSLATLLSAIIILKTAQGVDKIRLQLWVILVSGFLALGCIALSFANHWLMLFIAIFLLRHAGQGLCGDMAFVTLSCYLDADSGRARAIQTFPSPENVMGSLARTGRANCQMVGFCTAVQHSVTREI